jgi:dTMP kinase
MYERYDISLAFVAKRRFADSAGESLFFLTPEDTDTIDSISKKIIGDVSEMRKKDESDTEGIDKMLDIFASMPRPMLAAALRERGIDCFVTAEPTTLPSGKLLRRALSGQIPATPMEMAEMFARDRVNHNLDENEGIEKKLSQGTTVITDRYYYSSLAYQGAELGYDIVAGLNIDREGIRRPDICVFLDLSPEKSLARIGGRGESVEIYENFEYLTKTRKMFFDVFDRLRERGESIVVIDASGTVEEVADAVLSAVMKIYNVLD